MMTPSPSTNTWRVLVSRIIKMEMTKHGIRYDDLSRLLQAHDTQQSAANLRNKINRGILGADLFLQLLLVLGVNSLEHKTLIEILEDIK